MNNYYGAFNNNNNYYRRLEGLFPWSFFSSLIIATILSVKTARILSMGSMKPRCVHLGIVVRAWLNPNFCRM